MFYFLFLIILPIGSYLYSLYTGKKKAASLVQSFAESFGKSKYTVSSSPKDVSSYLKYVQKHSPDTIFVDDTTWHDLSIDEIFMALNQCQSSPGEELFFATLHQNKKPADSDIKDFETLQNYFEKNPQVRAQLQLQLEKLGKSPSSTLIALFDDPKNFSPYKEKALSIFAYLPFFAIPLGFLSLSAAIFYFLATIAANLLLFFKFSQDLQRQYPTISYLNYFLHASKKIFSILPVESLPNGVEAKRAFSFLKTISAKFSRVEDLNVFSNNEMVLMMRGIRSAFLRPGLAYNKGVKVVQSHLKELLFLYNYIGNLDMAISIGAWRKSLPYYCFPTYGKTLEVSASQVYHPMLCGGVPNNFTTNQNVILTGSNASGKSTFLKTLAINTILSYSTNTCCAKAFALADAPVYTSMAISDSIFKGESYFIAEIKSIRRILEAAAQTPCLCFIDEILRGTNTIERIAASTAILEEIAALHCLCMIATHDIELTEILGAEYALYHFREKIENSDILFDYTIYPGPSKTRNAIELLNLLGFAPLVIQKAKGLAQHFEQHHQWKPQTKSITN